MKTALDIIFFSFSLVLTTSIFGQTKISDSVILKGLESIPIENIHIHSNNRVLFTGEYFYYTVYCINKKTKSLSNFSKLSYVELISQDSDVIFKHKIWLKKGIGYGDFFIPVTVPSGYYKLIGYTNWMKNGGSNTIYKSDVLVINPYQSNQSELSKGADNYYIDSLSIIKINETPDINSINDVTITTNKNDYGKRTKVSLNIFETGFLPKGGNYSISVRKKNFIEFPSKQLLIDKETDSQAVFYELGEQVFLPELRGELIEGRIVPNVENIELSISIPGETGFFSIARTDSFGRFFANVPNPYQKKELVSQVLTGNIRDYTILFNQRESLSFEYKSEPIYNLLTPALEEAILKRSVSNQIQNAYFEFRPDSLEIINRQNLFKNKKHNTYVLDDYTRFKTLEETVVEILKDVFVERGVENNKQIMIQGYEFHTDTGILPLVLLDGVMIKNTNDFLNYDTRNISSISVYRNHFVFGSNVFQGALLLESKENNGYSSINGITSNSTTYQTMGLKKYFKQLYGNDEGQIAKTNTIPDYRYQLDWRPHFKSQTENSKIEFFTSDISGKFEIYLEGISSKGKLISLKKSFVVE